MINIDIFDGGRIVTYGTAVADSGAFKGDKGDKGDPGEDAVIDRAYSPTSENDRAARRWLRL